MGQTPYEKLVGEVGEAEAKKEMKRRRKMVKHHPGGSFRDPEFAKQMSAKGVKARAAGK